MAKIVNLTKFDPVTLQLPYEVITSDYQFEIFELLTFDERVTEEEINERVDGLVDIAKNDQADKAVIFAPTFLIYRLAKKLKENNIEPLIPNYSRTMFEEKLNGKTCNVVMNVFVGFLEPPEYEFEENPEFYFGDLDSIIQDKKPINGILNLTKQPADAFKNNVSDPSEQTMEGIMDCLSTARYSKESINEIVDKVIAIMKKTHYAKFLIDIPSTFSYTLQDAAEKNGLELYYDLDSYLEKNREKEELGYHEIVSGNNALQVELQQIRINSIQNAIGGDSR